MISTKRSSKKFLLLLFQRKSENMEKVSSQEENWKPLITIEEIIILGETLPSNKSYFEDKNSSP